MHTMQRANAISKARAAEAEVFKLLNYLQDTDGPTDLIRIVAATADSLRSVTATLARAHYRENGKEVK